MIVFGFARLLNFISLYLSVGPRFNRCSSSRNGNKIYIKYGTLF